MGSVAAAAYRLPNRRNVVCSLFLDRFLMISSVWIIQYPRRCPSYLEFGSTDRIYTQLAHENKFSKRVQIEITLIQDACGFLMCILYIAAVQLVSAAQPCITVGNYEVFSLRRFIFLYPDIALPSSFWPDRDKVPRSTNDRSIRSLTPSPFKNARLANADIVT